MNIRRFCARTALALTMAVLAVTAYAQQKEIKIGVIYDYTGPLAAGGHDRGGRVAHVVEAEAPSAVGESAGTSQYAWNPRK